MTTVGLGIYSSVPGRERKLLAVLTRSGDEVDVSYTSDPGAGPLRRLLEEVGVSSGDRKRPFVTLTEEPVRCFDALASVGLSGSLLVERVTP